VQLSKGPFSLIKLTSLWFGISLLMVVVGVFFMLTKGFNMGVDFTGGTSLMVRFTEMPKFSEITSVIEEVKLEGVDMSKLQLQAVADKDVVLKTPPLTQDQQKAVQKAIKDKWAKAEVLESDTVGPTIGAELKKIAIWIVVWAFGLLLIYITFRFEFWYALAAIIAMMHDSVVTLGIASMLGIEINGQFIAAILTILGYSINDTIVIFDRMRENTKLYKHAMNMNEIADVSLWQTMTRSFNTGMAVLFVLLMIYFFGGSTIRDFALTMFIGIVCGTYSSIFTAAPLYIKLKKLEA
jgi:preprotein translocase subunit SecF